MIKLMPYCRLLSAVLTVLCMAACGGETPEPEPVKLVASPDELVFESTGGTKELTLTSGVLPAVTCTDSWVSIRQGETSGNTYKFSVTVGEYKGTDARSSNLRVIGEKQSLMIPVKQNVPKVELSVDRTSLSFNRFGGVETFTVTSSTQPAVSTDAKWIGVSAADIDSSHKTVVTVSAAANRTATAGSGSITVSCGGEKVTVAVSGEAYSVAGSTAAALTPQMVFDAMGPGWNMGNQMDAVSNGVAGETVWGNPKCTQATFDAIKAAGLKSVRICVTWAGHIGDAPAYRLDEKWLGRVEEIVGYAEKAGLVAIVNTHHDESSWQDISKAYNNSTQNEKVKDEIFCVWTQIASRFADKGEWLVFESFNEIQDGGWGWSTAFRANPQAQYKVLNEWNQVFVDAVRATGGNNATRWLGVPGYAANPGFTIAGLVLPKDYTDANRLMVAVHDYDPYDYTLKDPLVAQWGHTADPQKRCSDRDEENVVAVFDQLKEAYLDKGIPVYLGEFGCSRHSAADLPYQEYYIEYFCKAAADRGLPMYLWDNGVSGTGSETHGYFDHGTGAFMDNEAKVLVGLIVKAVTTKDPEYTLQSVYDSAP